MFGALWQGKVPSVPENFEPGPELAHDVEAKDGDFCFCYLPVQGCHYHYTSAEDLPLAQIAVEYEGGVGLAIGGSFMLVSYCSGLESCFGYLDEVDDVAVAGVPTPPKGCAVPEDLSIEATEIWALEPHGAAESQGPSKSSEIDPEQTRLTSLSTECRHPWVSPASPFNLFRSSSPVYMVPAHLSIKTVSQILLKREGDAGISAAFSSSPIANLSELTVEEVYEQFLEDSGRAEELNRILDLKYDRQKVL